MRTTRDPVNRVGGRARLVAQCAPSLLRPPRRHASRRSLAKFLIALRASERKKGRYVVLIGRLKGVDIATTKISLLHDVCPAPGEYWLVLRPYQHLGHKPCMTTIAVGDRKSTRLN